MNYWLIALPREDMEHCIEVGCFGLNRRFRVQQVREGDKVACYVTKEYKIIGLGEATSDYFVEESPLFKRADAVFADRFKFKLDSRNLNLNFMDVIDKMSFITNMAYWAVYFRNSIVQLTKEDWVELEKLAKSAEKAR